METIEKQNLKPGSKIMLDHLGQYYASINCEANPGTFSVSAHLKELVKPNILQQATDDLVKRLPHLNVQLKRNFFQHYHEVLENSLKIVPQRDFQSPASYFKKADPLTRIIYGDYHLTIEVLHTVCDGRSLAKIMSALLVRYFELQDFNLNKAGIIECSATISDEEVEDAAKRYADLRKSKHPEPSNVYKPKYQNSTPKVISREFDLNALKAKAKTHEVTVTEYIMAHIMNEFAKQRQKAGGQQVITANIPVDCRKFFPTECLRNFVAIKTVIFPESLEFPEIAQALKKQLATIDADYIQDKISEMENIIRLINYIPLFIKGLLIKKVGQAESEKNSIEFSNLGLIKLPQEIQSQIETLSFTLGAVPNMPYQFGCVAFGNVLRITTMTVAKDNTIVENIYSALAN